MPSSFKRARQREEEAPPEGPIASGESTRRPGFKQRANSLQAKPNKTKQNCLDFLGFIRPNRDFSMGYEQKNKKNRLASQVVCKASQAHPILSPLDRRLAKRGVVW
jgi:hypothetical protein